MKSVFRCCLLALLALLGAHAALWAQGTPPPIAVGTATVGSMTVQNAWSRASAGQSGTGVAYLSVITLGPADRLIGASSPAAARAELHESSHADGVMRMRPMAGIDILPNAPAELTPNGRHIMLIGLVKPLRAGESFPLTLRFAHAPELTVTVPISPAGAAGPTTGHGH